MENDAQVLGISNTADVLNFKNNLRILENVKIYTFKRSEKPRLHIPILKEF